MLLDSNFRTNPVR